MMLQGKSEFISIGCNRVPGCLATMKYCQKLKGLFAYGANHVIALGWPAISCDFQTCHSSDIPLEATISSSGIQRTLNGHSSRVNQVKFVDTNKEKFSFSGLVSACAAGELIFWKLESTDRTFSSVVPNARIQAHAGGIECLDLMILDTGRVLVLTAGADETVKTWLLTEAESGIQWTLLQEIKLSSVLATTLSLSGPLKMECGTEYAILAIATTNNQVQMYSSLLKEPRGTLFNFLGNAQGHEGWVRTIDFTFQKGQLIMATGSMDKYIRIWRVQSKFEDNRIQCQFTMISLLIGHDAWIYNVKFLQQSEDAYVRLLSSSADGSILLWQSTVFSDDVFCMGEISWNTIGTMGELSDTFGFYGLDYYVDAEHTVIISHSHSGSLHLFLVLSNLKCTIQNCLGFTGHIGAVRHVAWQKMSSGEYVLASVSDDCTTRLYIQRKKELDKSKNLKSQIPIGRWLEVARPQIHGYEMRAISFLPLNQGNLQFVSAGDEKVEKFEACNFLMIFIYICVCIGCKSF